MNLIGLPVMCRTDNAAPPRASPSTLVSTTPGQRQRIVEGFGGIGGVLTGHGIDHEQGLDRIDRRMHRLISAIISASMANDRRYRRSPRG